MKKNNLAELRREVWRVYCARAALIGAVLAAVAVFSSLGRHPAYRNYYIGIGVMLLLGCLVIGVIGAALQSSTIRQRTEIPATIPFAQDDLHFVEGSGTIYLGNEWLLWKNGLDCRMFPKEMIEMDYVYGNRRADLVKGFMALKLKTSAKPVLLMYRIGKEDAVAVINQWLEEEKPNDIIDAEIVTNIVYCPYCGAANKQSSRFCQNCGAPLKIQ